MQLTYDKIQYYHIGQKEKDTIKAKLKTTLSKEKQIKLALLFGSLTRRNSVRDIDLAVQSSPPLTLRKLLELNAQIELELGFPVDMVQIADLPVNLRMEILRNGELIKGTKKRQTKLLTQKSNNKSLS